MQQPPGTPPQWSADGKWWWDGTRWLPSDDFIARQLPGYVPQPSGYLPPPVYGMAPAGRSLAPSPGLRAFLLIMLSLSTILTGLLTLFGLIGETSPTNDSGTTGVVLFTAFIIMFAVSALALVAVTIRASWAQLAAIAAGVVVSLSCIGLVLGIPIIIAAARAPDLSRARA
ncbi:MAG TPA: hypothetical protein VEL12_12375 [Candidatus Nitrosopolaris sp.]|nr:hypothetical protein [Candidatus Nitrosopolaris sp.]